MQSFTIIISVLAVISIVLGVVATIVVRVQTVPNWNTIAKVIYWIIGILLFKLVILGTISSCHKSISDKETAEIIQREVKKAIEEKSPTYEWYWKLTGGATLFAKSEPALNERLAYAIPRTDGSIWADVPYTAYDSPERERIRLEKVGDKSWAGTWEQDNPAFRARITLDEISPGIYAGDITLDNSKVGRCHLKEKVGFQPRK